MKILGLVALVVTSAALIAVGCSSTPALYCDETQACTAGHPVCDLEGVCPMSGGIGNTCIPEACWDAGSAPDASQLVGVDASIDASIDATAHDGALQPDAAMAPDARPVIVWGEMVKVANVNSDKADYSPSISTDGLELYLASSRTGSTGLSDIWVATRSSTAAAFGTPTQVGPAATANNEFHPEIASDGLELFFYRPAGGGCCVWVTNRTTTAAAWGTATSLNITGTSPAITGDGLTLYYVTDKNCAVVGNCVKFVTRASKADSWDVENSGELDFPVALSHSSVDISSDNLGIVLSGPQTSGQPLILLSRRAAVGDDFMQIDQIPTLAAQLSNNGVAWNKDETEIYLNSEKGNGVGDSDIWISVPE